MIRQLIFISAIVLSTPLAYTQVTDTLSNLPDGQALYAPVYDGAGQWGYVLGQNSSYRQQFAEKYHIKGNANVKGLIVHLNGTYQNPENYVEFNVYEVAPDGLPGSRIGGKQLFYKDLDLSGNAMTVTFSSSFQVADSFFVTFNVLDYLHGGFEGDTLGLMAGEPGSRQDSDLENFGRNAVQAHNHNREDWKDFYTQNFTPIATHLALFPIVESGVVITGIEDQLVTEKQLTLFPTYPNPATHKLNLNYYLDKTSIVSIHIHDMQGKQMYLKSLGLQAKGEYQQAIDVHNFPGGTYLYVVESGSTKLSGRVLVK